MSPIAHADGYYFPRHADLHVVRRPKVLRLGHRQAGTDGPQTASKQLKVRASPLDLAISRRAFREISAHYEKYTLKSLVMIFIGNALSCIDEEYGRGGVLDAIWLM